MNKKANLGKTSFQIPKVIANVDASEGAKDG